MIPYGGLYFFYLLLLLLIPAIILGINEKSLKLYGMAINILFIILLFGSTKKQLLFLLFFYLTECILVVTYSYLRKHFQQRWLLWIMVILSLMPLLMTKSANIFFNKQLGFLGISYLTFKVIQVLIETYDRLITKFSLWEFTYFLLFFPTISSGPIDRSRRFTEDINTILPKSEYVLLAKKGLYKIFLGIFYKFVIGAIISTFWLNKLPSTHTLFNTVNYMYAYSFFLFFDFAGYSLMAIGCSYILGVKTPDNFNLPFISKDIKDFWNRWHMSLSFWFRDYIYTRFVMTSLKKKRFKNRYVVSYIGYLITMLTMGIWHGTEKSYLLYGVYHGCLIVGTDLFHRKSKWYKRMKNNTLWNYFTIFITFHLICFGFLIFSGFLFKNNIIISQLSRDSFIFKIIRKILVH